MAVNVLVVPEDFRKDQYVLKPIVEKMIEGLGYKAKVQVCRDPLLGGVGEALKWERLEEILTRYKGMTRLILLVVDKDCKEGRRTALDGLEDQASVALANRRCVFLAENAWQEVEVWVLAGLEKLPKGKGWAWSDIRAECDPKEAYYDKVARRRGLLDAPYEGRETLAKEAAGNYPRIRQLCPEDVGRLEARIGEALEGGE
jgi:hypothetical protein